MDGDGDMVMTNTEQTFPPAEAGNHLRLLLGQIEDVLHQPCLLIFHLLMNLIRQLSKIPFPYLPPSSAITSASPGM